MIDYLLILYKSYEAYAWYIRLCLYSLVSSCPLYARVRILTLTQGQLPLYRDVGLVSLFWTGEGWQAQPD